MTAEALRVTLDEARRAKEDADMILIDCIGHIISTHEVAWDVLEVLWARRTAADRAFRQARAVILGYHGQKA